MADPLVVFFAVLRVLSWPFARLLDAAVFVVAPCWAALTFLLLPLLHLANTILQALSSPFTVRWRDRFETLYVFLGIAALVGCFTGTIVFVIYKFLSSMLTIDATMVPTPVEKPRTAAEYRAARREKREEVRDALAPAPVVLNKVSGPRRRGLLSQAIIEEEDSDF